MKVCSRCGNELEDTKRGCCKECLTPIPWPYPCGYDPCEELTRLREGGENVILWAKLRLEAVSGMEEDPFYKGKKDAYTEVVERLERFEISFLGEEVPP